MMVHSSQWLQLWLKVALAYSVVFGMSNAALDCWWTVKLVEASSLQTQVHKVRDTEPDWDISSFINTWDIKNLHLAGTRFHAYPYFLKLMVSCQDQVKASLIGRSYALSGGSPKVSITYKSLATEGLQSGKKVKTLIGALVDVGQSSDAVIPCNDGNATYFCDAAWLVPFSLDHIKMVVEVAVFSQSVTTILPQLQKIHIYLDGYSDETLQLSSLFGHAVKIDVISSQIRSGQVLPVTDIPQETATMALGPFGSTGVYIFTNDEFKTYHAFESSILNGTQSSWNTVCNCAKPMKVASLPDRILFLTNHGLVEIFGNFSCPFSVCQLIPPNAERSFNICTNQILLPLHKNAAQWDVMLMGACDQEGKLFAARLNQREGSTLNFVELLDSNGLEICDTFNDSVSCSLMASAVTAWNRLTFVTLVLLNYSASTSMSKYAVVHFVDSNWEIISTFPAHPLIPLPNGEPPLISDTNILEDRLPSNNLLLSGLTITNYVSSDLFIWGKQLLHSPDQGKNVYLLNEFTEEGDIVLFVTSQDGYFCFLTDMQEIWSGVVGSQHLKKIYPSIAWNVLSLEEQLPENGTFIIISMFYDTSDQLQMLTVNISEESTDHNLKRTMVPVAQLLRISASMHDWASIQSPLLEVISSHNLLSKYSISPCPFREMVFSVPQQHIFERIQEYSYSPPDLNWQYAVHNNMSLMVYQAAVHQLEEYYYMNHGPYADNYTSHINRWKDIVGTSQLYYQFLFQTYQVVEGMKIDVNDFKRVYEETNEVLAMKLPPIIYLSRWQNYTFHVQFNIDNSDDHDGKVYNGSPPVDVDVKVDDTVKVNVTLTYDSYPLNASVVYRVCIQEQGQLGQQEKPGVNLYPASIHLAVSGAALSCFHRTYEHTLQQSDFHVTVMLGCPATQTVVFDQEATFEVLSDPNIQDTHFDCATPDPDRVCFYFNNGFYPVFRVLDLGMGQSWIFEGQYSLKIIGGSPESADRITHFSTDEIFHFNSPESSKSQSLMWGPEKEGLPRFNGFPVFTNQTNGLRWLCQRNTDCSNIMPKFPKSPEYFFLVEFSNRDIDTTTYCDYTMKFIVHVHGLPIDPINMSLVLVALSTLFIICYTAGFYVCHKEDAKLLTAMKQRIRNKIHPAPEKEPEIEEDKLDDPEYLEQLAAKDWKLALALRLTADEEILEEDEEEDTDTEKSTVKSSSGTLSDTLSAGEAKPNVTLRTSGKSVISDSPGVSLGYVNDHRGMTSVEQPSHTDLNLGQGHTRRDTPSTPMSPTWSGARPKASSAHPVHDVTTMLEEENTMDKKSQADESEKQQTKTTNTVKEDVNKKWI